MHTRVKKRVRLHFGIFALLIFPQSSMAIDYTVIIPSYCQLTVTSARLITSDAKSGEYKIFVPEDRLHEAKIRVSDFFGAHRVIQVDELKPEETTVIRTGRVNTQSANPIEIDQVPALCPRVYVQEREGETGDAGEPIVHAAQDRKWRVVYDGRSDFLNARPRMHLLDPDVHEVSRQKTVIAEFDDKNVLRLKRIRLTYDYEDSNILDYQGPHPLRPEEEETVYEGDGGFYANLHYAIMPYEESYLSLNRQETLHLIQGKLQEIDRADLTPPVRVHSFLPGAYLSKSNGYALCEWGDTAYQAKLQELYYHGMVLWDWDIQVKDEPVQKILLFVWEGDEEDWMIADGLLDPFYLTDDLVGTFVIDRKDTIKPQVLRNRAGDFEIEVVTR